MSKKEQHAALVWREEAQARLADADRVIAAQREIIEAQHQALMICGDAIHAIRRAIGAYTDVKTDRAPLVLRPGGKGIMSRLPLPPDLCRCLGHEKSADRVAPTVKGKGCKKADSCARHQTIRWDRYDGTLHVEEHLCLPGAHEHYLEAYAEGQP